MAVSIKEILGAIATIDGGAVMFKCAQLDGTEITLAIPVREIMPMIETCSGTLARVRRGQIIGETRSVPFFEISHFLVGKNVEADEIALTLNFGAHDGELVFQMAPDTAKEIGAALLASSESTKAPHTPRRLQ